MYDVRYVVLMEKKGLYRILVGTTQIGTIKRGYDRTRQYFVPGYGAIARRIWIVEWQTRTSTGLNADNLEHFDTLKAFADKYPLENPGGPMGFFK